jgi:soluble lytic murein transglycosylase-like protein
MLAALIAAMALVIVVLPMRSGTDAPNADDRGMPAVAAGEQFPASSPRAIGNPPAASPASVEVRAVPDTNRPPLVRRGGDNAHVVSPVTPMPWRPDDPVLHWLPEILAAAGQTGVSPALIAGVIQTESQGDPASTSPHGARGLMQVMPDHLVEQGVREAAWDDPAANILAGAWLLKWNIDQYGSEWDGIAHYFGIGCDGYNCTDGYVHLVLDWKAHYAPLLTGA